MNVSAGFNDIGVKMSLAVHRCLILYFAESPSAQVLNSAKSCMVMAACSWTYTLMMTSPMVFGHVDIGRDPFNISCGPVWYNAEQRRGLFILLIGGGLLPLAVITFCCITFIVILKRVSYVPFKSCAKRRNSIVL